jgi:hypothetical protein
MFRPSTTSARLEAWDQSLRTREVMILSHSTKTSDRLTCCLQLLPSLPSVSVNPTSTLHGSRYNGGQGAPGFCASSSNPERPNRSQEPFGSRRESIRRNSGHVTSSLFTSEGRRCAQTTQSVVLRTSYRAHGCFASIGSTQPLYIPVHPSSLDRYTHEPRRHRWYCSTAPSSPFLHRASVGGPQSVQPLNKASRGHAAHSTR